MEIEKDLENKTALVHLITAGKNTLETFRIVYRQHSINVRMQYHSIHHRDALESPVPETLGRPRQACRTSLLFLVDLAEVGIMCISLLL
jgi:hypothetical protein